jgi:hypothetical protein
MDSNNLIISQNMDYFDALYNWLSICFIRKLIPYHFVIPPHQQITFVK